MLCTLISFQRSNYEILVAIAVAIHYQYVYHFKLKTLKH